MRRLVVVVLALGLVACGGSKEKADKAAVETYINTDLNGIIGVLWVGKKPLDTVKGDHFENAHGWFAHPSALDNTVIPRMDQVLAGLAKITPPESMKNMHQQLVEVATIDRDAAKGLGDAVAAEDKAKFAAAYAKAEDGRTRYLNWQKSMDAVLDEYKITLKDPPPPPDLPK